VCPITLYLHAGKQVPNCGSLHFSVLLCLRGKFGVSTLGLEYTFSLAVDRDRNALDRRKLEQRRLDLFANHGDSR
jgi:hypothetical protein